MVSKTFNQLKKNLKLDSTGLKNIRVALLGDTSTQLLNQALVGLGKDYGFNLTLWEADFNQIERQVFDHSSDLYEFNPDVVILFQASHKLLCNYNKVAQEQRDCFADRQLELIKHIYDNVSGQLMVPIIFYNYPEIDDSVFGGYSNKMESSFLFQVRKLNYELMLFALRTTTLYICDISAIQNRVGRCVMFNPSIYVSTEMVLSIDVLPEVAARTLDLVTAMQGRVRKCLILDLDNTLWGGVIGDDGIENIQLGILGIGKAFSEFQHWIKKLKDRGIILCVCSKNTESVAKEAFEKHPDMVLRLDDIAVFVANWENKVDNIRLIQQSLNISFDSMVFLDDNPVERNIVRENVIGITVPELPEDPANFLEYLYSLNLFETLSFSNEDLMRTHLYQVETKRKEVLEKFTNEDDFLESLNMVSIVEPFNKFNAPRIAQLSQRSNQFNLRTVRYNEENVASIIADPTQFGYTFSLEDKFGDNGIICAVILKIENENSIFIDTWFMSCRVLKRGMEKFVLNMLVQFVKDMGGLYLIGEFTPTAKNEMVKDHYLNLGFLPLERRWQLVVSEYKTKKIFINRKKV
jgi:FkbH-like protein